jgi:5-formyltetrahydrofolate cyclo-ligase
MGFAKGKAHVIKQMDKTALRKLYLEKRLLLTEEEIDRKSQAIHDLLFSRLMIHRYDKIHCYLPVQDKKEVDTNRIIQTLHKDFPANVYVPKIHTDGILTHHIFERHTPIELNRWGVPEPANEGINSEDFFNTDDDILVIVPLLVYDKKGNRIGYGKGYYDRFLACKTENTLTVGLSFFEPEEYILDTELTDIPLNYVFTPERVWGG